MLSFVSFTTTISYFKPATDQIQTASLLLYYPRSSVMSHRVLWITDSFVKGRAGQRGHILPLIFRCVTSKQRTRKYTTPHSKSVLDKTFISPLIESGPICFAAAVQKTYTETPSYACTFFTRFRGKTMILNKTLSDKFCLDPINIDQKATK